MTQHAKQAAQIIQQKAPGFTPAIAIALGSGSGGIAQQIKNAIEISYEELPGFPLAHVKGHDNKVILGEINGVNVACLKGRAHYYEGFTNEHVQTMVRTLRLLGAQTWFATNASGSLHPQMKPGSLVVLKDHINFQFRNVLVGPNDDEFGERFISMENAYDRDYRAKLAVYASQLGISITEGVYVGVLGPVFETPAEIRAYKTLGADLVGMSTIPEVTVARHCGMKVAVIAIITNLAAGMNPEQLSHEVTLKGAQLGEQQLTKLLLRFIEDFTGVSH